MKQTGKSQIFYSSQPTYLVEQISLLKSMLSYGLSVQEDEIKISFPSLQNFYTINDVCKSSWSIYIHKEKLPKLLYTGNYFIQGGNFTLRSKKSPFGAHALSSLTSIANTFSFDASFFKQNWTYDLNLFDDDPDKLKFTVKEYQEFLKVLNVLRAKWLLHLSEEANSDFVIIELSEPQDQLFFIDLENIDSTATKIKTYFKPVSQKSLDLISKLSTNTEFEGKFLNLQPGIWLRDDVLIEMEKYYAEKFYEDENLALEIDNQEITFNNPFKIQSVNLT